MIKRRKKGKNKSPYQDRESGQSILVIGQIGCGRIFNANK